MIPAISQLHENKQLISVAQTIPGRLGVWLTASALLLWHDVNWLMLLALALVMGLPERRRLILSIVSVLVIASMFLGRPDVHLAVDSMSLSAADTAQILKVLVKSVIILTLLYLAYFAARNFSKLPALIRRVPLLLLHIGIWSALIVSSIVGTGLFGMGPFLAWRLSYLVSQARRGAASVTEFRDHLFYLMPVFGGTSTPYGKGLEYLSRHEAVNAENFARAQLAGMKLLILAVFWSYGIRLLDALVFGQPGEIGDPWFGGWNMDVPRPVDLMQSGRDVAVHMAWSSIYLELVRMTLVLAATGHVIVGCLRLLGFNVFRNTYKPLLSETVVDFWSRYYYYFKELLVELFFYPTFFSCTWAGRKLRMFIAVFAAAFLGNMYYHFLLRYDAAVNLDTDVLWADLGPRLVYCALLTVGIWVSMLRQEDRRKNRAPETLLIRGRRILVVWTFFGLINIWNMGPSNLDIMDRINFAASLFFM